MSEYTMTYRQAFNRNACFEGLDAVGAMVGGWWEYGVDTPVSLVDVMDRVATDYALWALYEMDPPAWRAVYRDFDNMEMDADARLWWWRQPRARAHLRMVLGGRIQPGQWRASEGWRS